MITSTNNTESNPDTTPKTDSGYTDPDKEPDKEPEVEKDDIQELYEDEKKEEEKEPVKEDKEPVKEDEYPVKEPATGYEKDLDKEPEKKEVEKDESSEGLKKEELDKVLGELPEGYDRESTSKFALDNKMSKEQMEAYVKFAQEESKFLKSDQEAQALATKKQWLNQLKEDSLFGGELFTKNVDRVEKLLDKHMPNMKKVLTDRGTMLPPYIMKDLLAISKVLNPTAELVNGEPSKEKEPEGNFLDDMYK